MIIAIIIGVIIIAMGVTVFKFRDQIAGLVNKGKQKKEDLKKSAEDLIRKV